MAENFISSKSYLEIEIFLEPREGFYGEIVAVLRDYSEVCTLEPESIRCYAFVKVETLCKKYDLSKIHRRAKNTYDWVRKIEEIFLKSKERRAELLAIRLDIYPDIYPDTYPDRTFNKNIKKR